ncbi:IS481 family transposase, partial [Nocardia sp. NPDC058499]|uniref:IS481 family transposase n=1 Tax=Nocardia sp. NPDC058499 TaxID=3346530 RepID=UPI00366163AF
MVETQDEHGGVAEGDWMVEHRFRAVAEVLDGSPVAEVARRYGTSRQSVHAWLRRFREGGREGLKDRSRRPHTSPSRVPVDVEIAICQLRQTYPKWGARRIAHELAARGIADPPGRSTVHRILVRNGLVERQVQVHRRVYRRWQRDAPMQLWQMDIMGGVFLADGRECKLVTGIDDCSRFIVIAAVLVQPSGRAVCQAFIDAMRRFGVPSEVLTDNGKQFTGRYSKPLPTEIMFERVCRENGIFQRLTKPRSPTTTGKIERFHKTLRREMLDHSGPFADATIAQTAIDAWVHAYNHTRPHQSLEMATPAQVFRPHTMPATPAPDPAPTETILATEKVTRLPMLPPPGSSEGNVALQAVEFDAVIRASRHVTLPRNRSLKFSPTLVGRTVTIWVSHHTVHVLLDGQLNRTRAMSFTDADLQAVIMRGGRIGGPEPRGGVSAERPLAPTAVVEVDCKASKDGVVSLGTAPVALGSELIGKHLTLRFDGNIMYVIHAGLLVKTLPAPIPHERRAKLTGARTSTTPLPAPPSRPRQAIRRIGADGTFQVAGQKLRPGIAHAGKTVTVVIEVTRSPWMRPAGIRVSLALVRARRDDRDHGWT